MNQSFAPGPVNVYYLNLSAAFNNLSSARILLYAIMVAKSAIKGQMATVDHPIEPPSIPQNPSNPPTAASARIKRIDIRQTVF